MLDTIRVKYHITPTREQFESWTESKITSPTGERKKYFYNHELGDTMLKYTYIPIDYTGEPLLTLEFSLPKLIFKNNHRMITDLDEAITAANVLLATVPHAPALDLDEGVLIRLDMCYNHQVGDLVNDYIKALGYLEYPHRRTKHHRQEGVEFKAKKITLKFYNKKRESGRPEAAGILRQEITLINPKDIQKLLGTKQPTLMDITKEFVKAQLESELQKLGLLGNSIHTYDTALKTLCDQHGDMAGFFHYGLLRSKMNKSKKEIAADSQMHPRSLDRKLRAIVDTGIPLTLTETEEPLPPLEINL